MELQILRELQDFWVVTKCPAGSGWQNEGFVGQVSKQLKENETVRIGFLTMKNDLNIKKYRQTCQESYLYGCAESQI